MGKIEIKKALRFALIGLGIYLFFIVFSTILDGIFIAFLQDEFSRRSIIFIMIAGILGWILYGASFVFLIWWLVKTRNAVENMEKGLRRDVNTALILLILVFVFEIFNTFIIAPIVFGLTDFNIPLSSSIISFINLTLLFSYLLVYILPVRRILSRKEMYLILIGVIVLISVSIPLRWFYTNVELNNIMMIGGSIVAFFCMSLILIGYIQLYQGIEQRKIGNNHYYRSLETAYKKGGWRGKFTRVTDEYSFSLIGIAMILILINSSIGYFIDKDRYEEVFERDDIMEIIGKSSGSITGTTETTFKDRVSEGDEETYYVEMEGDPENVKISFKWEDEPDSLLWENQPDTFEVKVDYPGGDESDSLSNPQGGAGEIEFEFIPGFGGELEILVSLIEAGNYRRPVGPGFMERTDDYCDFEMFVTVGYPNPSEE